MPTAAMSNRYDLQGKSRAIDYFLIFGMYQLTLLTLQIEDKCTK